MIRNYIKDFLWIAAIIVILSSCKKASKTSITPVQGNVTLNVHVLHHAWELNNIKVYLKYNTVLYPGPDSSLYDKYEITDGYGKVSFTQLYPGNYYIYGTGFDASWGANVIGYKQIILSKENIANNEMSVILYVSE